ncbi:integrase core domain-containing protein [Nonomuraea sp. NPDC004354]
MLTDNGSCHRSRTWADALSKAGTKHKRTRPYTPRTNGKVERHNGTLARGWAHVSDYTSEHERRVALANFLNYYNHERPHAALDGKPPISRTIGSDYRVVFDQPPEPLDTVPQQLTFEDIVEPTS